MTVSHSSHNRFNTFALLSASFKLMWHKIGSNSHPLCILWCHFTVENNAHVPLSSIVASTHVFWKPSEAVRLVQRRWKEVEKFKEKVGLQNFMELEINRIVRQRFLPKVYINPYFALGWKRTSGIRFSKFYNSFQRHLTYKYIYICFFCSVTQYSVVKLQRSFRYSLGIWTINSNH